MRRIGYRSRLAVTHPRQRRIDTSFVNCICESPMSFLRLRQSSKSSSASIQGPHPKFAVVFGPVVEEEVGCVGNRRDDVKAAALLTKNRDRSPKDVRNHLADYAGSVSMARPFGSPLNRMGLAEIGRMAAFGIDRRPGVGPKWGRIADCWLQNWTH